MLRASLPAVGLLVAVALASAQTPPKPVEPPGLPTPPADFAKPESPPKPPPFEVKYVDSGIYDPRLSGLKVPQGCRVELVAEALPTRAGSQSPVRLRLNYLGKPLDGALVMFSNKAKPKDKIKLRADAEGRVATVLPQGGVWLATAVHMVPAPFYAKEDWNSLWASLSFELR